jgi:hypothetical protein
LHHSHHRNSAAISENRRRNSCEPQRTWAIKGLARIEADEEVRRQVYEMMPEVEQTHDPDRTGACLIIDVTSVQGLMSGAPVSVVL